jgi:hypothetical protein
MTVYDSGENDQSSAVETTGIPESRGLIRRFRDALTRFKKDIREPLPNAESLSRYGKVRARLRHLLKRYGWKMFWTIFAFYLIRDAILYLILPYLVARQIIG